MYVYVCARLGWDGELWAMLADLQAPSVTETDRVCGRVGGREGGRRVRGKGEGSEEGEGREEGGGEYLPPA